MISERHKLLFSFLFKRLWGALLKSAACKQTSLTHMGCCFFLQA